MAALGGPGGAASPGSVSRTARYRKVTKPLLERKRRARINRCLDELKDLMVGALEVERENISKLEKADILELTVRHLSKQRAPRDPQAEVERFQAGFGHCASEAYHFILSSPGVDSTITRQLVRHLSAQMGEGPLLGIPALASPVPSDSSLSPAASCGGYSPDSFSGPPRPHSVASVDYDRPRHPTRVWKDETPSVPIEQTLTCEVPPFDARPVPTSRAAAMTGLLMTVEPEIPTKKVERQRTPEFKERYEPKVTQTAESKHLIMQKIREHILERQHRDFDPRDVRHNPRVNNNYSAPIVNQPRPTNYPASNCVRDANQFPQAMSDNGASLDSSRDVRHRGVSHPGGEEAINLSSIREKCLEDSRQLTKTNTPPPVSEEERFKAMKRRADYKSIHPKKVMIRIPENNPDHEMGESSGSVNNAIETDRKSNGSCELDSKADDSDISAAEAYYLRYKYRELNKVQHQYQDPLDDENMWRPW